MGVGDILRRSAVNFPDKEALIFEEERITYSALNRRVNRIANRLLELGLQAGDRIAVLLHNGPEFIEIYFACAKSGIIFVPVNNLLKARELIQIFSYVRPRALVFDDDFSELTRTILPELPFLEFPIDLGGAFAAFPSFGALVDAGTEQEPG